MKSRYFFNVARIEENMICRILWRSHNEKFTRKNLVLMTFRELERNKVGAKRKTDNEQMQMQL